ncbi:MAG: threonylcarbamoyl-AMP synthase [Candidatus Aenigmarchaeota archaeon]|nr:threonylcarbamoyl-AMP synthase [Candidatus Aenigmarchaeota archaeon]
MEIIRLSDALGSKKDYIIESVKAGKVFVYPTDTVYGIGCDANNSGSVSRIKNAKGRDPGKPMSVIAPSFDWIEENATGTKENLAFVKSLLPGPYTVILKATPSAPKELVSLQKTIGIRIPLNKFTDLVRTTGIPFVTTSANLSGEEPIKKISELPEDIKALTDIAIDAGEIDGLPSRVFDLSGKEVNIVRY